MTTAKSFLLAAALSGITFLPVQARAGDLRPGVVTNPTGTLDVVQHIPCDNTVHTTSSITGGRLEFTPAEGIDVTGGKQFSLTRATLTFAPFSASGSCDDFGGTQSYSAIGVQLVRGVTFVAPAISPGVYSITIPKESVSFWEGSIANGSPENGYMNPSQDLTGTIDLNQGTVQMHVVVTTSLQFREGCVPHVGCVIDETDSGTLTTDLSGTITFPDTDGDGVPDRSDNCRFVPNPTQALVATPTITAPANLTLASCADHQIGIAAAADVCDGGPVTVTDDAPATFATGANTVTWTAADQKSRTATATQIVTVVDTTPPVFTSVPPDLSENTCGPVNLGTPTATDDCAGTVTFTNNAPGYFYVGSTPVTWTATDASGNKTTATQMVNVVDTTAPALSCTSIRPIGNGYQISASDACGAPVTQLGGFVLGNNEIVKIDETGQPGVRFMGTVGADHIRYFQVGKGEAVITTTDGSGNVTTAVCGR